MEVFALLNEGSLLTVLEKSVADQLGLDGPIYPLTMHQYFVGTISSGVNADQWQSYKHKTTPND